MLESPRIAIAAGKRTALVPATVETARHSTDSTVFTVAEDGAATARAAGEVFCAVEADGETDGAAAAASRRRFTGRASVFVTVP